MRRNLSFRGPGLRALFIGLSLLALLLSGGCDRCKTLCTRAKTCLAAKGEKMTVGQFSDCEWHCRQGVERRNGKGYDEYGRLVERTCREK
ncbi:MAG: hypothetical protein KC609_13755 [Myxococcales bacterium]|nr:hypothetical protein [Myxococcales bacterium]